jgi:4-hydroxy-tetrahydrodipicolinate reductase
MQIRVCLAGATGWAGSELAKGIARLAPDLEIVAGVSRTQAGRILGEVVGKPAIAALLFPSAEAALREKCDVFVEYTKPESAKSNVLAALEHGAHVVIGTSGLTDVDLEEIGGVARERGRGVLACGNFSLTAVLVQRFAEIAAKLIPQWEIVDYASDRKKDSPSGTVRELASRLAKVRQPEPTIPIEETQGLRETRGATLMGTQVHSLRLPGYVIGFEAIFGMTDQRLTLRHDAGNSATPYVDGAILAIRKVSSLVGLHRGLETVLDL